MTRHRFRRFLALQLLPAAMLLAAGDFNQGASAQEQSSVLIGKPAPEFHVQGIFNETYSLEKFKGHILVMQFGTSW